MRQGWGMWMYGGAGPGDTAIEDVRRRMRPDNEVPGSVALDVVLGASDEAVVFISGARAYTNGVEFHVEVRVSKPGPRSRDHGLGLHGDGLAGEQVLLGVEFADGRRCSTVPGTRGLLEPRPDDAPSLMSNGGGGSLVAADVSMFLSPLPTPGLVRLVCAWPSHRVAETVTELPADVILEAAARARVLWPVPPQPEPEPPPAPDLPAGSWFAPRTPSD